MIGIYEIKNLINNHRYIGSSNNIEKRWKRHIWMLNKSQHHSLYLQRAWDKYGCSQFSFSIIEVVSDKNKLFERESFWIQSLSPQYNLGSIGGGDNISNHPNLRQIKQKHRDNYPTSSLATHPKQKFGENNPNWKGGISKPNCIDCGKSITSGRTRCSVCSKQDINNPFYGKKHTQAFKDKLSKARQGKKPKNSQKVKIDGKEYLSKSDAAKALGVTPGLISYRFKMKYPNYELIT